MRIVGVPERSITYIKKKPSVNQTTQFLIVCSLSVTEWMYAQKIVDAVGLRRSSILVIKIQHSFAPQTQTRFFNSTFFVQQFAWLLSLLLSFSVDSVVLVECLGILIRRRNFSEAKNPSNHLNLKRFFFNWKWLCNCWMAKLFFKVDKYHDSTIRYKYNYVLSCLNILTYTLIESLSGGTLHKQLSETTILKQLPRAQYRKIKKVHGRH